MGRLIDWRRVVCWTLYHIFGGGAPPSCVSAADGNDDGAVDTADAIYLLRYLYLHGPVPPAPFGLCGPDETPDALTCESYRRCQ